MKRFSESTKSRIKELIIKGYSLNVISKELNAPKGNVYYHFRKIKGRTYNIPTPVSDYSEKEGEIIGIFTGDGWFTYYKPNGEYKGFVCFGIKNKDYANYVKELYNSFFNREFILIHDREDILKLRMTSKIMHDYFHGFLDFDNSYKALTVNLKKMDYSSTFLIGFIRGMIDTDGSVEFRKDYVRIQFNTSSKKLMKQIGEILKKLDIDYRIFKDKRGGEYPNYHVAVRTKKDNLKLANLIKSYKIKNGAARTSILAQKS